MKKILFFIIIFIMANIVFSAKTNISIMISETSSNNETKYIKNIFEQKIISNELYFNIIPRDEALEMLLQEKGFNDAGLTSSSKKSEKLIGADLIISLEENIFNNENIVWCKLISLDLGKFSKIESFNLKDSSRINDFVDNYIEDMKKDISMYINDIDKMRIYAYDKNIKIGETLKVYDISNKTKKEIGIVKVKNIITNPDSSKELIYEKINNLKLEKDFICEVIKPDIGLYFDKQIYTLGEKMKITIESESTGYFYLYDLRPDGTSDLIFPQYYEKDKQEIFMKNYILSKKTVTLNNYFVASEPFGEDKFIVFFSPDNLNNKINNESKLFEELKKGISTEVLVKIIK